MYGTSYTYKIAKNLPKVSSLQRLMPKYKDRLHFWAQHIPNENCPRKKNTRGCNQRDSFMSANREKEIQQQKLPNVSQY